MTDQTAQTPRGEDSIWRNRDFVILSSGELVSGVGSTVASFALPIVIFAYTGSPAAAGLTAAAGVIRSLSGSILLGAWVDRHSRRAALLWSLLIRVGTWSTMAALLMADRVNVPAFAVAAFIGGLAAALFQAGQAGALKEIVPRDQFPAAVAVNEARGATASLSGGPLGGVLLLVSAATPFLVNAATFLISFASVLSIRSPLGKPDGQSREPFLRSVFAGFSYIWSQRAYRTILPCQSITNWAMNGFVFVLILSLQKAGEPYWKIGFIESAVAIGILLGSVAAGRIVAALTVGRILTISTALMLTGVLASTAFYYNATYLVPIVASAFLLTPASNGASAAYLAITTPDRLQGRVGAAEEFSSGLLVPLAAAGGGILLELLGSTGSLLVFAVAVGLALIFLIASGNVRSLPSVPHAEEVR